MLVSGTNWKNLPQEKKKIYIDEAENLRQEHMKRYPDYKYRPRRRKGLKKTAVNQTSHHEREPTMLYNRTTTCSSRYIDRRFPRSDSFSYNDLTKEQSEADFRRLSSSAPVTRLSMSPESNSPSSSDEYAHEGSSYCPSRRRDTLFEQVMIPTVAKGVFDYPHTSGNGLVTRIPVPKDSKMDLNANYCHTNSDMGRYCNAYFPGQQKNYNMSQNRSYNHMSTGQPQSYQETEFEKIDISDINPDDMDIYINPNNQSAVPKQAAVDLNVFVNQAHHAAHPDRIYTNNVHGRNENPTLVKSEYKYEENNSCSVPAMMRETELCRDIPSVCYEFDAQPMINAITNRYRPMFQAVTKLDDSSEGLQTELI